MATFRKIFFFADDRYWRYDIDGDKVEQGWPKQILDEWRRWPTNSLGDPAHAGGTLNAGNGTAYFFFGQRYFRFDMGVDRMYVGPLNIADYWPGVRPELFIEAAVRLGNDEVCLFHGNTCTRFNMKKNRALEGYPKRIAEDWPGMPDSSVNAALNYGNGSVYFFHDNLYTRFDLTTNHTAQPWESIAANWHGLPDRRIDAAIEWSDEDFKAACVPIYDPDFWNADRDFRVANNCYNYGCNRALWHPSDPGRGGTGLELPEPMTIEMLDRAARLDGLEPVDPDNPSLPGCSHLIMMFLSKFRNDFHFYHRNSDGMWSHKVAKYPATNEDAAGNRITDPRTANRAWYDVYCGTYRVDRSKVRLR